MSLLVGPHDGRPALVQGRPLEEATAAMILVHGRGASAGSIVELRRVLDHPEFAYFAPEAANNSWYPHSFLAPLHRNEPGLSSGLQTIGDLVTRASDHGIQPHRIVIGGFSQGACLASEFVARNPRRYGGLLIFSGGLIGPAVTAAEYPGSLEGTPAFLGCSDRDAHIPLERVEESAAVLTGMGAAVVKQIYPNMGHTIIKDEIDRARQIVTKLPTPETERPL